MVQPDIFEAFYAAHPGVPKTVVRKIYEWNVSNDPDIFPLYYDKFRAGITTFHSTDFSITQRLSLSNSSPNNMIMASPMGLILRKQEPIILTVRNRPTHPA